MWTDTAQSEIYLERVLVPTLLLKYLQHLAIDSQAKHLAGHLVVVCNGILLNL